MITIYDIKPQFQQLLRPLVNWLAKKCVTPNQVTIFALGLSIITGGIVALFYERAYILLIIPLVMFIRMALNAIDGMLAKEHNMKTDLGKMLNELADCLSDAALFLPFALIPLVSAPLIVLIVVSSIISEMSGVLGENIGASRRYDGPMGKSDRAFLFGLLALLLAFNWINTLWLTVVLSGTFILILINIYFRMTRALQEIQ